MSLTFNGLNGLSSGDGTSQNTAASGIGFKNRIINGDMRIDQRNIGAQITPSTSGNFTLDRWMFSFGQSSKFNIQQNGGGVTPPPGFTNYLGATVASAVTSSASDYFILSQTIEGYNMADWGWGTANAVPVTMSFWIRSSLVGTHGGCFRTYGNAFWSCPFSYTISSANTWEYKTVTIPAQTYNALTTTNNGPLMIFFDLGCGSDNKAANGWAAGNKLGSSASNVSVVGTSGATWYITGVQVEKGSTATPFDYVPFHISMYMCERYYEKSYDYIYAPGTFTNGWRGTSTNGTVYNEGNGWMFRVPKRDLPTVILYNAVSGATGRSYQVSTATSIAVSTRNVGRTGIGIIDYTSSGGQNSYYIHYTAESEI